MSGHSKWAQIKRKKEASDAKKGQLFTKLASAITLAVKERGESPKQNFKLRLALEKARAANMPKESINRAIKKGLGKESNNLETITYEAYGPGGIALLIEAETDNKNRTTSEVRRILEQNKASLADSGSVKWLFKKIGFIKIEFRTNKLSKEDIELLAIDKGAENIESRNNSIEITSPPEKVEEIKEALSEKGIKIKSAFLKWSPVNTVTLKDDDKKKLGELIDALKKNEDVARIYHNAKSVQEDLA